MTLDPSVSTSSHRQRLLEGMGKVVAKKGYADTTIADIVSEAGVSRRTFYEHFQSKGHCLIALYESASLNALGVLRDAINAERDWHDQVEEAMTAYFGCLAQNPVLLRTLFIEILGLGPVGLAARRRMNTALAAFMLDVVNGNPALQPEKTLSMEMATAVVGGINELVLEVIEQDRVAQLHSLVAPSVQLVRAVA
jgi:AcrR family transcriptional regulator